MRTRRHGAAMVLAASGMLACGPAAAIDFREGLDAYEIADYERARQAWEACAEAGSARAQYGMGILNMEGRGVPRDAAAAVRWFRLAAVQGLADAQLELGVLRAMGADGVEQDVVQAFVWFELAVRNGDEEAVRRRDLVGSVLTDEERAEAERRLEVWATRP